MLARCDENLQPYNTLGLAARAKAVVTVDSNASLREALAWARERGLPVIPLGEGSNVVIAGNLDALVLRMATQGTVPVVVASAQPAREGDDTLVARVRTDVELSRLVSTVDNLDWFNGIVSSVLALDEMGVGTRGHYGEGRGAAAPIPSGT